MYYTAPQMRNCEPYVVSDQAVLDDASTISRVCYSAARRGKKSCISIIDNNVIERRLDVINILQGWGFKVTRVWFCFWSKELIKLKW